MRIISEYLYCDDVLIIQQKVFKNVDMNIFPRIITEISDRKIYVEKYYTKDKYLRPVVST